MKTNDRNTRDGWALSDGLAFAFAGLLYGVIMIPLLTQAAELLGVPFGPPSLIGLCILVALLASAKRSPRVP